MTKSLQRSQGLNPAQLTAIRQLEAECNAADGLTMKLNLNALRTRAEDEVNDFLLYDDDKLIGYMALYSFNKQEVEISAMTHPAYRQQGVFKEILNAAREEVERRNIPDFLFICERASPKAAPAMAAMGATYDFSEFKMVLQESRPALPLPPGLALQPMTAEAVIELAKMDRLCFAVEMEGAEKFLAKNLTDPNRRMWSLTLHNEHIGKIGTAATDEEVFINAFCILPDYRGQGYGKAVLSWLVAKLVAEQHPLIVLEVETENEGALGLYKQVGFAVTTAYDYYRLPVL